MVCFPDLFGKVSRSRRDIFLKLVDRSPGSDMLVNLSDR
jgi:hypothetical protein